MNEPWLIGQSERGTFESGQVMNHEGNFQNRQFNQGQDTQTTNATGNAGESSTQGQSGPGNFGQAPGTTGSGAINANFNRGTRSQGSLMSVMRGLHEGKIGNTNIKWLVDLAAIAMILLTGTGIYLSIKVLRAEKKKINRTGDNPEII